LLGVAYVSQLGDATPDDLADRKVPQFLIDFFRSKLKSGGPDNAPPADEHNAIPAQLLAKWSHVPNADVCAVLAMCDMLPDVSTPNAVAFSALMPFMERESSRQAVVAAARRNLTHHASSEKPAHILMWVNNASGTGKTRLCRESRKFIEDSLQIPVLYVGIDYSNGDKPDALVDGKMPHATFLGLRIAARSSLGRGRSFYHLYHFLLHSNIAQNTIWRCFTVDNVMQALRLSLGHSNKVGILLHQDEYQCLFQPLAPPHVEQPEPTPEAMALATHRLKEITAYMVQNDPSTQVVSGAQRDNFVIFPMFSGPWQRTLRMHATDFGAAHIPIHPALSTQSAFHILQPELSEDDQKGPPLSFNRLVAACASAPRFLSFLRDQMRALTPPTTQARLTDDTVAVLGTRVYQDVITNYRIGKFFAAGVGASNVETLLRLALAGTVVQMNMPLLQVEVSDPPAAPTSASSSSHPRRVARTLGELAETGFLFAHVNDQDPEQATIFLPHIILYILLTRFPIIPPHYVGQPGSPFSWRMFERLCCHLIALTLSMDRTPLSFSEMCRQGVIASQTLLNRQILRPEGCSTVEERNKIATTTTDKVEYNHVVTLTDSRQADLRDDKWMFLCADHNPLVDARKSLRARGRAKPALLLIQFKYSAPTTNDPTISLGDVVQWQQLVVAQFAAFSKHFNLICHFITNRRITYRTAAELQSTLDQYPTLAITDASVMEAFLPSTLSHLASDVDPPDTVAMATDEE